MPPTTPRTQWSPACAWPIWAEESSSLPARWWRWRSSAAIRWSSDGPDGLHLDQRHLRHRAARRRRPAVALGAGRLAATRRPALGLGADRLRDLLGLGRHRPVEIFEAELVEAGLVLHHDDPHMAAGLELAEQHLVGERLLDRLLDQAGHRPRPHLLVVAVLDQPLGGVFRQLDGDVAVAELGLELQHELLYH